MPPDPTNLEDMVHTALFAGKPVDALLHASQLDRWLSAHLADIMEPLTLIDNVTHEESVSSRSPLAVSDPPPSGFQFAMNISLHTPTISIQIPPCGV